VVATAEAAFPAGVAAVVTEEAVAAFPERAAVVITAAAVAAVPAGAALLAAGLGEAAVLPEGILPEAPHEAARHKAEQ
jgi:hypothetical protein